jgi:hypothetical protein
LAVILFRAEKHTFEVKVHTPAIDDAVAGGGRDELQGGAPEPSLLQLWTWTQ